MKKERYNGFHYPNLLKLAKEDSSSKNIFKFGPSESNNVSISSSSGETQIKCYFIF